MKAITIWQPWASLIMHRVKPYEFRGWAAPKYLHYQRIAIHAGARPVKKQELADIICRMRGEDRWTTGLKPDALALLEEWHTNPAVLPRSAVLGTATLGPSVSAAEIMHELGGPVNDSNRDEHANFAWPLGFVEMLIPPVNVRGAQGFWDFNDSVALASAQRDSQ